MAKRYYNFLGKRIAKPRCQKRGCRVQPKSLKEMCFAAGGGFHYAEYSCKRHEKWWHRKEIKKTLAHMKRTFESVVGSKGDKGAAGP